MFIAELVQSSSLSTKKKELFFRFYITLTPLLISSAFLILFETPILFLFSLLKKFEFIKDFYDKFKEAFKNAILIPLLFAAFTWMLYGLFIYPREVHANMNMTSSSDLYCLRNTISSEYLKDKKLILDKKHDNTSYQTKSEALIDQCFDEKKISAIFKTLFLQRQLGQINDSGTTQIDVLDLADGVRERIVKKLKKISKYKELKKNYCSADEYQFIYRIAYIARYKKDLKIEDIFKEEWLEKFSQANFETNKIEQDDFKEYFFKKIRANDRNEIEKKYEDIKGAGKSIMTGGQIVKYFAKVSRYFIVTVVFGQIYKFLDESIELLKKSDHGHFLDILKNKLNSKVCVKIAEFIILIVIFFILYYIFERSINEITQAHAITIIQKLNSDSGYIFGVNKKENQQLIMDHGTKSNNGENRDLLFQDSNAESVISYRILLNLAIFPLLEQEVKDEFYLSS